MKLKPFQVQEGVKFTLNCLFDKQSGSARWFHYNSMNNYLFNLMLLQDKNNFSILFLLAVHKENLVEFITGYHFTKQVLLLQRLCLI